VSDTRLVQLENSLVNLTKEFNDFKSVLVEHLENSKVERSDKLLSATETMKKLGISDDIWAKIKRDPTFPKTKLTENSHMKYSDKTIDAWIVNKQIFKSH